MSDFIDGKGVGMVWPGPEKTRPAGIREEWGIKVHGNDAVVMTYDSYSAAMRTLTYQRTDLRKLGIPEQFWPILVSRTVETAVGSWRQCSE